VKAVFETFIGQTASVFWFNYLHVGEGLFAEVSWSKKCSQTNSCWS